MIENKLIWWCSCACVLISIIYIYNNKDDVVVGSSEYTLKKISEPNQWLNYFKLAEKDMSTQWSDTIYPFIKDHVKWGVTLEIGPGGGRNTAMLLKYIDNKDIYLVDLNQYALDECQKRFKDIHRIHYYQNDGETLPMIDDTTIEFVYSWDSMVHFHRDTIKRYLKEFYRVMKKKSIAFLHHSNINDAGIPVSNDFKANPHWRNRYSCRAMKIDAEIIGFTVVKQTSINWGDLDNKFENLDCLTLLQR